ncbi:P-loop containing nucleoside triphosphate hydrolase protein [Nemania sp. FL0031]|nr:P-loop containing nucleoside triphosphate hydrolase protein [Nemania sp. FL0031]
MSSDKKRRREIDDVEEKGSSPPGSTPALVSTWYKRVCKQNACSPRWSEFRHPETEHEALVARTASVPIIHRLAKKGDRWETGSITVQDITMRKVLTEVLKYYQDLDLHVQDYTFTPPFQPLCDRWEALGRFRQTAEEPDLKQAALKLVDFLTPTVAPSVASMEHIRKTGTIRFADLWRIFPPETLVSAIFYGVETTISVMQCHQKGGSCKIKAKFIDWNGKRAGFCSASHIFNQYSGYRRITSLAVFPISFLEDEVSYRASMVARGKIFEKLRGYHFMIANGTKISPTAHEDPQVVRHPIAGKVCIDTYAYYQSSDRPLPRLKPLPQDEGSQEGENENITKRNNTTGSGDLEETSDNKGPMKRVENLQPLTDDQRLLATPWVRGFDLTSKEWCQICLAWEFAEAKSLAQSEDIDDFTFTAEAMADKARVPLYAMSAAELGTTPADVEKALSHALGLCRMWNAMLLLDEVDLVSIFLRKLEYYQGTMFLTTNRIASIDSAFQSRVDLFPPYYDLTSTARREVWCNFIKRAGQDKFDVTDESLEKLAALPLNGREIKNLIKSALLLSLGNGAKVSMNRVFMLAERRV